MADEQQNEQSASSHSETDAQKKMAIPQESLSEQDKAKEEAAKVRGEHLRMMEQNKEMAQKYGQPDFQSLLARVGSDGLFAQQLVQDLVSGDDAKFVGVLPDAPQEKNITGNYDHTQDTPTKVKTDTQSTAPATENA